MQATARSPWEIAADLLAPPSDGWEPLPHQIPPAGNWFGWLLLGGRGAGKTATAARYVHDHVHGPPCLPGVPGGHWIGIIGPTLGDAATSCVYGPSGLRVHDPGVRIKQTAGGATVRWSNGAEAKLFGAHTPEDVERLRSGGNRCFVADTPIEIMRNGTAMTVPIYQAQVGDLALTRQGYMPIDRAGLVARSERIWEVHLSDGTVIKCTGDHRWHTSRGTVTTQELVPCDNIPTWDKWRELLTDRSSSESPSLIEDLSSTGSQADITAMAPEESSSTGMFGNVKSVLFQRAMKFITKTWTGLTIVKRTCSASLMTSTLKFIMGGQGGKDSTKYANSVESPSKFLHQRLSDHKTEPIARPYVVIETMPEATRGSTGQRIGTNVQAVEKTHETLTSVVGSVMTATAKKTTDHVKNAVSHCLGSENVSVLQVAITDQEADVYCVRVPGPHEIVIHHHVVSANCLIWAEELAAWRYLNECWQHMRYGLRVGPWPHWIASTTPKPKKLIKELKNKAITGHLRSNGHPEVVMTSATTKDNPHLDEEVKKQLFEDYGGTRLGRQELYAEILDDVPNALWLPPFIDETRIDLATLPHLDVIVIGVDPPAKETGAECGIIVTGKVDRWDLPVQRELGLHDRSHGFVLDDRSKSGRPDEWAKAVVGAFDDWKANRVVVEINNGGDMVKHTLRQIRQSLPVREVHASRGKAKRAEPVATLYEQRRIHHIGHFPHLEDQQLTFDPDEPDPDPSPDRMDGCVWAFTDLMVSNSSVQQSQTRDDRLRGRR